MRYIIRSSIASHYHYQKLLLEVKKKFCNHKTILNERCFAYLEAVFQDMFRIEKLYKRSLSLIHTNRNCITVFNRPKNFVQLSRIVENTRSFDWEALFRDDKDYCRIQKQKAQQQQLNPSQLSPGQSRKSPSQGYNSSEGAASITCKQLVVHLSHPLGFENHLYSDDDED